MNKLDVLEELLPGFSRFLSDLTTVKLTSDLEAQVNVYTQNIEDYEEQHYMLPSSLPPDPPTEFKKPPGVKNGEDFIAKQRELARLAHTSVDKSYVNVGQPMTEPESGASQIDNFYEPPTKPQSPPVPVSKHGGKNTLPPWSKRPPIRVVDDQEAYEEPDDITAKLQGKSATLPAGTSKQASVEPEAVDSGGTFISYHSNSSSQPADDLSDYEMMPDSANYDDDDSWGSTDYEDYDEDEISRKNVDTPDTKTKPKKDEKPKKDKFELFQKQHEGDTNIDHIGILYNQGKGKTISKKSSQWDRRYCFAKDMHLYGYKNPDSKKPATDVFLLGSEVSLVGQEGKHQNVFSITHPHRGADMFSAGDPEDAEKWIEVLKGYATMGNEFVPSTGYLEKEGQGTPVHTGDEITKSVVGTLAKIFKRDKKGKDTSPQLSLDENGNLSGYINIMGAKYGEPKWRKKFLTIQKGELTCYTEDGDTMQFVFLLNGSEMGLAGQKETKRKAAMKITKDSDTLIFVEALNPLDMGHLLKKFMEEMTMDQKKDTATTKQQGMVSDILKAFEKQGGDTAEQQDGGFYDDVLVDVPKVEESSTASLYQNFKIVVQHAGRNKKAPTSPSPVKKYTEDAKQKEKKVKKKDKTKDKKRKDGKEAVQDEVKDEEVKEEKIPEVTQRAKRMSVKENKFEKSDKRHLLDIDRLEIERKDVEAKKRQLTKRKIDLRSQKMETTDAKQKELLEGELKTSQQEWSECSNQLAYINSEIERVTKGGLEAPPTLEEKQDTASAEMAKNGIAERRKQDRSPGREVVTRSAGNVQNKLKMFQEMNNK